MVSTFHELLGVLPNHSTCVRVGLDGIQLPQDMARIYGPQRDADPDLRAPSRHQPRKSLTEREEFAEASSQSSKFLMLDRYTNTN